jgi:hypothetical protein
MSGTKSIFSDVVLDITKAKPQAKIVEQDNSVTIFNEGVFPQLIAESLTLTIVDGHKVVFSYEENMAPADHTDVVSANSPSRAIEKSKPKIKAVLGLS